MTALTRTGDVQEVDGSFMDAALLADIITAAAMPLWVIGPDGRVVLANPAAVSFLGYRSDVDVVGGPSHDLLHSIRPDGSHYSAHDCPIVHSHGSAGAQGAASEWFLTRHGDLRSVSWSAGPIGRSGMTLLQFGEAPPAAGRAATGRAATGAQPSRPTTSSSTARSRDTVRENVATIMRARFRDPMFSLAELSAETHLSIRSLQALFQGVGRPPGAEIRRLRLEHAYALLQAGHGVRSACHESGHLDPDSFSRAFRRHFGLPPSRVHPTTTLPHSDEEDRCPLPPAGA